MGGEDDNDVVENLKARVQAMRAHRDAGSAPSPNRISARCAPRSWHLTLLGYVVLTTCSINSDPKCVPSARF
jgi:hypothetical protein